MCFNKFKKEINGETLLLKIRIKTTNFRAFNFSAPTRMPESSIISTFLETLFLEGFQFLMGLHLEVITETSINKESRDGFRQNSNHQLA
jgi:hypothetical protein